MGGVTYALNHPFEMGLEFPNLQSASPSYCFLTFYLQYSNSKDTGQHTFKCYATSIKILILQAVHFLYTHTSLTNSCSQLHRSLLFSRFSNCFPMPFFFFPLLTTMSHKNVVRLASNGFEMYHKSEKIFFSRDWLISYVSLVFLFMKKAEHEYLNISYVNDKIETSRRRT